ncbi:Peroxisome biosynthesis protein pex1 [Rhizophlyctis rosea]|nr:Peroxisome biosynthesis protein pex1 [Rhizophlyctis rosea]
MDLPKDTRPVTLSTTPHAKCIKLDVDAEVIVAPKTRRGPVVPSSDYTPAPLNAKTSPRISTRRNWISRLIDPREADIAVPPAYDSGFSSYIFIGDLSDEHGPQPPDGSILLLQKINLKQAEERASQPQLSDIDDVNSAISKQCIYVTVISSRSVPKGHVVANRKIRSMIQVSSFSRVRLQTPFLSLPTDKIRVHPVTSSATSLRVGLRDKDSTPKAQKTAVDAVREILQCDAKDRPLVLTDGMILKLPSSRGTIESQTFVIRLVPKQPGPSGSENLQSRRTVLYTSVTAQDVESLSIEEAESVQLSIREETEAETVPVLGGVDKILGEGVRYARSRLGWGLLRKDLGAPGGLLVYGAHGSGKSALAKSIAQAMSRDPNILARVIHINCEKLHNQPLGKVKEKLTDRFIEAAWHAPTVVLLDDLDRLIPAEQEHNRSANSRQLAEIFIDMAKRYHTRHRVMVIATSQHETSLHKSIITSYVFGRIVHLMSPDRIQRAQILDTILTSHTKITPPSRQSLDLSSISRTTEGYMPADLQTLVERAVQEAAIRHMRGVAIDVAIGQQEEVSLAIEQADFEKAQVDFVPSSLRGVKLQTSTVAWGDIGGLRETKRVLLETLEWPTKYAAIFANSPLRLRSGLLLYGYPGCGKTLLASAVAHECGLHFISVKGPELLNKYIGASEQSVRDLFERAQAAKPCVLFFDEFDSIAPRRGHDNTGVTDRVVNQLLTQMDGAEGLEGVYVLAATRLVVESAAVAGGVGRRELWIDLITMPNSRPDLIDPALLRPGRLDKSLLCDLPGVDERLEILQAVARKLELDPSIDLSTYAHQTQGFTGADLRALVYNAHLEAVHEVIDLEADNGEKPVGEDVRRVEFVTVGGGEDVKRMSVSERAKIAERLQTIQNNHAKLEVTRTELSQKASESPSKPKSTIRQKHLDLALQSTKPSITEQEKAKLRRVYDEFVGGRSAGGVEMIGQRATLA